MMTEQEAIKGMNQIKITIKNVYTIATKTKMFAKSKSFEKRMDSNTDILHESCEMAIEALKSQIPKKVKYYYIEGRLVNYHCPSCGEAQGLKVNKRWQKFCPHCGQALDWGKEDVR